MLKKIICKRIEKKKYFIKTNKFKRVQLKAKSNKKLK